MSLAPIGAGRGGPGGHNPCPVCAERFAAPQSPGISASQATVNLIDAVLIKNAVLLAPLQASVGPRRPRLNRHRPEPHERRNLPPAGSDASEGCPRNAEQLTVTRATSAATAG